MQRYVSKRATVGRAYIGLNCIVLGADVIGDDSFIDSHTILGYPMRSKLVKLIQEGRVSYESLDEVSSGCHIGRRCIVRSHSVIYEGVTMSDEVEIGHDTLIREFVSIGCSTRIGSHTVIDGYVEIGEKVSIQTGCYIPPGTVIEDGVFLGPYAVVLNDKYPPSGKLIGAKIRRGAIIGAGAMILPGVVIGEGAVVAAGSLVTRDVEPYNVVKGRPARISYSREEYEERKKKYIDQI
ncbi:MAG: DapH/DapD/GlmU-related protein [Nitrososphaerota archaeon]|nr:DapH/DapD/GlmU-related protein [Nitrososphaerota archaeon]